MTKRARRYSTVLLTAAGLMAAVVLFVLDGAWLPDLPVTAAAQMSSHSDLPDVGCTDCHREHHGGSLTEIDDSMCQACHAEVKGFPAGHPEYENFPYDRRTRINFDHVAHDRKHFPDSDAEDVPGECTDCHEPDNRGRQMPVKSFETACGACHAGEIRGEGIAGAAGIAVITIPGLDLTTLREKKAGIGGWPELSDRELTPFMRAMFAADPIVAGALQRFDALDPLNLQDASDADIEAVKTIAWSTKELFYDLIADGPATLQPQLSNAFGTPVSESDARAMLGNMSLEMVREAQAKWFPNLFQDVASHDAGEDVPMPASEFAAPADTGTSDGGSDEGSQESILGDDEGGSQESILGDDSEPSQESILGDDSEPSQESILGDDSGESHESILGDDTGGEQEDILSGDSGESNADILSGEDTDTGGGDILSGESESGGGDLFSEESGGEAEETPAREATAPEPNPEAWASLGGWYRDYFALLYRPGDHADPFIEHWMDLSAAAIDEGGNRSIATPILDLLTAEDAPGKCMKCHTVDAGPDGSVALNWHDRPRTPGAKLSASFRHDPHLELLGNERDCALCHTYDREADYQAGFEDRDPMTFHSNFNPIAKETCGECHVEHRAGNSCIRCHDYHVGHVAKQSE